MKSSYFLGVVAALLVVILGVIFIGRDGTTEKTTLIIQDDESTISTSTTLDTAASSSVSTQSETVKSEGASSSTEEILPENVVPDEILVIYTDAGFSPKTITVNKGDTVTFKNNSSRNMWVASNIHPTHNEYPEESETDCMGSSFDACEGVPTEGGWSFVFDRVGEWGYHDHLNASRTGTIIVE